jgi:hypothetical protein
MCHFCDHSLAILIQEMQGLLTILGVAIVTRSEIVLQIHLEVTVLLSTLMKEGTLQHRLTQVVVPRVLDP